MVKFAEAEARRFRSIFVCRRCKTKMRAPNIKIIQHKIKCRRCSGKVFRADKKK
ncbi:hypothetical protein HYX09_05190 [Candidatus Woesearchaeota archaeon]|nr:hypothetical protein [Candidatus Woesearchaeota archaeon]